MEYETQKKTLNVSSDHVERMIQKLPDMDIEETLGLWRNAAEKSADDQSEEMRAHAKILIEAINDEWGRRGEARFSDDEYFRWPSTDASVGSGRLETKNWEEEGVLSYMGYHVGIAEGKHEKMRRQLLLAVFSSTLPPVFHPKYLAEWDKPERATRLQKMAESIASFARNAKRRSDARMAISIREWEADLQFMYDKLYVGKFRFAWPTTSSTAA
jgi:hypothetical protein